MFLDSQLVGHAAVVSRRLEFDELSIQVGYIEAMAVHPRWRSHGLGRELLAKATEFCLENYRVSMLSTDIHGFYESHGWRRFSGLSFVATESGLVRTAEDDEGLMMLTGEDHLFEAKRVVCDFRSGDVW
jgi:aminoglycoside 2'-N-acetyltransferase I